MTKMQGKYFRRCLEKNKFDIKDGVMNTHSWNEDGSGIYRSESVDKNTGTVSMFLDRKDCSILQFFDNLDLKKQGNSMIAVSGKSKIRLMDSSAVEPNPDIQTGIQEYEFTLDHIQKASEFVLKKDQHYGGVTMGPAGLVGTDGSSMYRYSTEEHSDLPLIQMPTDILKMLEKDAQYKLCANKKYAVFMTAGEAVYTGLYETVSDLPFRMKQEFPGFIKLERDELMKHLKIMANISDLLEIEVQDTEHIILRTSAAGGEEDGSRQYLTVMNVETNIMNYKMQFYIGGVIRSINAVRFDTIGVNSKMLQFINGNEMTMCAGVRTDGNIEMVLSGSEAEEEKQNG